MDIRHLEQQIKRTQIIVDTKRGQADVQRDNARKMYAENDTRRQWIEDEAAKLEHDANLGDSEISAMQQELADKQHQLEQKKNERASMLSRHQQEIEAINKEIIALSGDPSLTL